MEALFRRVGLVAIVATVGACAQPVALGTGLAGTVMRGPVMPVCSEGNPCDAPFAASFTVLRAGQVVAVFESNAEGRFSVPLAPGTYVIVPDEDAPIMQPPSQTKTVVVGVEGMTVVQLDFDTGIR